ncbi:anti-ECFsigma factor, ChrR [Hymenobacter roseosalivarius DSM 11622]|uniref:Anti-ECFsigma factor, ChrR n=1 Tax=Hymenobacter roseosalivarius DSM 11622 TaxID=645990 RepID=A0A1W1W292_9BACT|nr:cupin domain-containing protein [Hymenobacter roseosalivarius]SMB99590.1 anti-ECFsigma factor, ChrR [Hymenobacter roseosalivarius DSM 11622]
MNYMAPVTCIDGAVENWERFSEGVEKLVLRAEGGESRVLLRIAAGSGYPVHAHAVPDEVFVVDGTYVDPGVEQGRAFGPGSFLYYPAGTEHQATSPSGCTILVWSTKVPVKEAG